MSRPIIILDANIVVKLLHAETDTEQARDFLRSCVDQKARILVPEHFLYELVNVCQRVGVGVDEVLELYESLKLSLLTVVSPNRDTWLRAEKIAQDGHPKSGFPSIYDSIYHAIALDIDGLFVTADKRHVVKAKHHGCVMLLSDWNKEEPLKG